jgi:reverse gyrase
VSGNTIQDIHIVRGIYRHACPNCGGAISDLRLLYKAPCEECLPENKFWELVHKAANYSRVERLKLYASSISKSRIKNLSKLVEEEDRLRDFEEFFKRATGFSVWSAQKAWARRLLRGESFSIIAPTGMGKTVFSLIAALYLIKHGGKDSENSKVYLAFPTTPLLIQSWRKLVEFARNTGNDVCDEERWNKECLRIAYVHSKMNKKTREFMLEKIKNGDFDVLLTTSAFMHRHHEIIPKGLYALIVMDDVDSVLKSGTAVRKLLKIVGLSDEDVDSGLELIKLRAKIVTLPASEAENARFKLKELEEKLTKIREKIKTVLVVNSATGRPRGIYSKLFKVFLGFEAGSKPEAIRNIIDTYVAPSPQRSVEDVVVELALKLKDGFLVFVPVDRGIEYAEYLVLKLREAGIKAEAFHAGKSAELIEAFARGEYNCLVGVATYYGTMVRGVDLPTRVKYVVFAGVPRHKFSSRLETVSPLDILRMLVVIRDVVEEGEREEIDALIGRLSRRLRLMSQGALMRLREEYIKAISTGQYDEKNSLLRDLIRASGILREKLSKEEVWSRLSQLGEVAVIREGDSMYILIPDVATYIQASGRCSRLYPGGITKGLSVLVVDDVRLLRGLTSRMRWIFEDFKIYELREIELERVIEEISGERVRVAEILSGKVTPIGALDLVKTVLFIVESPNKARTIANFFGKPSVRVFENNVRAYEVTIGKYIVTVIATGGHVYDLVVDEKLPEAKNTDHLYGVIKINKRYIPVYTDIKTCARGHQFTDEVEEQGICPKCGSPVEITRKRGIIEVLRKLASEADIVLIGTDPDAEGEKIGWDIRVLLEPYAEKIYRVEFHEVTRRAILSALAKPGEFDVKRVESQIVRRVEDRWLGFALSEIVQRAVWPAYCAYYLLTRGWKNIEDCCKPNRNLSAGRVQTPVLGYILSEFDKSRDVKCSKYLVHVVLERGGKLPPLTLNYAEAKEAGIIGDDGKIVKEPKIINVLVEVLEEKVKEISPPPPFTTDMLLEEASRKLGFSTSKTMSLAQDLFEWGLITYHRTDSTRVSDVGIEVARQFLEYKYGGDYKLVFKPRTWGAGGAHEAIRPTRPIDADRLYELIREGAIVVPGKFTRDHMRLYDLIFRRFIASQMIPAQVLTQKLRVKINNFTREVENICEPVVKGYLDIYVNLEFTGKLVVESEKKVITGYVDVENSKRIQYPLPRFHDVVRWMKENEIGRPSTYAKIIDTLIDRNYVEVKGKIQALLVTERGRFVYEFLKRAFGEKVDVRVTRQLEEAMSMVEDGKIDYQEVLSKIHEDIEWIESETTKKIVLETITTMLWEKYRELSSKALYSIQEGNIDKIRECIVNNIG